MLQESGRWRCTVNVILSVAVFEACDAQSGEWAREGVNDSLTPAPAVYENCTFAGDNDLAVSGDRIVLVSNCRVKITDKSGNTIAEALLCDGTEFASEYVGLFEPVVPGQAALEATIAHTGK